MFRNVQPHRYRMGAGYKLGENGDVTENYWERIGERQQLQEGRKGEKTIQDRVSCRLVCEAYIEVRVLQVIFSKLVFKQVCVFS